MRVFRWSLGVAFALAAGCLGAGEPKVIHVRESSTGLTYLIGGASVPSDDLSGYFSKRRADWNLRDTEVKVILSQEASFNAFFYSKARLQAVGFTRLAFFVQSPRTGMMVQIQTVNDARPGPAWKQLDQ